jgi:radical SAM superfamily enzyme
VWSGELEGQCRYAALRSGWALRGATHRELQLQEHDEVRHEGGAELQKKNRVDTAQGTHCSVYVIHFLFGVPWGADENVTETRAILSTLNCAECHIIIHLTFYLHGTTAFRHYYVKSLKETTRKKTKT